MKKSMFAVFVAMLFATSAFAQYTVKAGYTLSTQTAKLKEDNSTYKEDPFNMSGIYVGASYEFPLLSKPWGDVSVNPGLTYSFYGKTVADESETIAGVKTSARECIYEHYLDLPVHGKYTYDLIPGKLKLSGYAGPVLSFGLASTNVTRIKSGDNWAVERVNNYNGNSRSRSEYNGEKSSEKHKGIGSDYSMFDIRFTLGVSANLFDMADFCIGYDFGLLDRYTDPKGGSKTIFHTHILRIGLAYSF